MLKRILRKLSPPAQPRVHRYQLSSTTQAQSMDELLASRALFIISPGRSGTKSLVDLCARNTSMFCVHAPEPWVASIGYRYHLGELSGDAAQYGFYATREPYLLRAHQQQRVFFDGDCKNLPLSLEIAALLPNARFIHLVRQPQAFIRSGLARGYYLTTPHELWGHLTDTRIKGPASTSLNEQIQRIAYFWNEANLIAERAKEHLGKERVTTIVAESLFQEPQIAIDALRALELDDVILPQRDRTLGQLNAQRHRPLLPDNANEIIHRAVGEMCTTRTLYYD